MKILLGYSYYKYDFNVGEWYENWLAELRKRDLDIEGICLTLNPPNNRLTWKEIEYKWRNGDKELYKFYRNIEKRCLEYDIFINYNGINLHPEFIKRLNTINVYSCFDDPESSEDLSKPVAWAYDLVRVGNIACIDMYEAWGCKKVKFWPLTFRFDSYDPTLTVDRIKNCVRTNPIALLCERESLWRRERLDKFIKFFPEGAYYGKGWPNGFLDERKKIDLYQNTRIGINIHNSIGPVNFRTFEIPANGAMLLCDNKKHLGKIYELGKEAIGFDTIEEAIDLCNYYLKHEDERLAIAIRGWERVMKSYNPVKVFTDVINDVKEDKSILAKSKHVISLDIARLKYRILKFGKLK